MQLLNSYTNNKCRQMFISHIDQIFYKYTDQLDCIDINNINNNVLINIIIILNNIINIPINVFNKSIINIANNMTIL